jgi:DNA-binding winged helix-turn-helix (wHTH) protein
MTDCLRLGPYLLNPEGILQLDGDPVFLKPLGRKALLVLVKATGMVSRQSLIQALWPDAAPQDPKALTQVIHGLRRALDQGPLGGRVIVTVYGQGYGYKGPLSVAAPADQRRLQGQETALPPGEYKVSPDLLHKEAWARWRSGNPQELPQVVNLLMACLAIDPLRRDALIDLCHGLMVQAAWGMVPTLATATKVQALLRQAQAQAVEADTLAAIHAELTSILFWQPQRSDSLYGRWLPQRLPLDRPLLGWIRHLIFSGQSKAALVLLDERLQHDLPQGWGLKAYAHIQLGHWPEAEAALRKQMGSRGAPDRPPVELAVVYALQGKAEAAVNLVDQAGSLDGGELTSQQALAGFALAQGAQRQVAAGLLERVVVQHRSRWTGAMSLWGLVALALGESAVATRLLSAAVRERCGLAPLLLHGSLLDLYDHEPAVSSFRRGMLRAYANCEDAMESAQNNLTNI